MDSIIQFLKEDLGCEGKIKILRGNCEGKNPNWYNRPGPYSKTWVHPRSKWVGDAQRIQSRKENMKGYSSRVYTPRIQRISVKQIFRQFR